MSQIYLGRDRLTDRRRIFGVLLTRVLYMYYCTRSYIHTPMRERLKYLLQICSCSTTAATLIRTFLYIYRQPRENLFRLGLTVIPNLDDRLMLIAELSPSIRPRNVCLRKDRFSLTLIESKRSGSAVEHPKNTSCIIHDSINTSRLNKHRAL